MASESEGAGPEGGWHQLHPASVLVNLLPRAWRVIRQAWPVFVALLFGGRGDPTGLVDVSLLTLFFAMTVGSSVVHWATLRYRVAGGRLEIRSGLLNRQVRVIDPRRVQNVERTRNVFQRLANLVEVKIETASGTEVEGMLSALSTEAADELIDELEAARREAGVAPDESEEVPEEVLVQNTLPELFTYGATATRLGAGALVVMGLMAEGLQLLSPDEVEDVSGVLAGGALLLLVLGVLTGTWLLGTGTAIVRHWGFRLVERQQGLVATEGLLTQRRVELKLEKIQLVSVREPWLRRMLGFGSVLIETAAAREQAGGTVSAEAMAPLVQRGAFGGLVAHAIPGAGGDLLERPLRPPHPNALRRALLGGAWRSGSLAALLSWWFWPWGLLACVLVPLALATAWLDYRYMGWLVDDRVIVARQGYLDRRTTIVPRDKLQSLEVRQGPLRRRWGLGVLVLRVAGSQVRLPDLAWEEVLDLQDRLAKSGREAA